jgi:hypothetical protein
MFDFENCGGTCIDPSWEKFGHNEWTAEVCERLKKVTISSDAERTLLKETVNLTRCHKKPLPGTICLKGGVFKGVVLRRLDRLHSGGSLARVCDIDGLVLPADVYFFRSEDSHMNKIAAFWAVPGFQVGLMGVTVEHIEFDVLHCMDLGEPAEISSIPASTQSLYHALVLFCYKSILFPFPSR